jgi:peroxiredoxin
MRYLFLLLFIFISSLSFSQDNWKVNTGDNAIDFTLQSVAEEKIQLSTLNSNNPLVLIVLRGWPEYQCPVCSRQVGQFIDVADKFQELGANVLMIYPGPSNVLKEKAQEFAEDFTFPDNFHFALDPDYSMVNKYGLRWNAPRETAYPSTFVIDKTGKIVYSKISTTHGGRAAVEEVLEALGKL